MKLIKRDFVKLLQECINCYGGEHGKIKPVFKNRKTFKLKDKVVKKKRGLLNFILRKIDKIVEYSFEGSLSVQKGVLYVCIKGTNDILDWHKNFQFLKRTVPYKLTNKKHKVHNGFLELYLIGRRFIHQECLNYDKVVFFGHSLGGILAQFAGLDLKYLYPGRDVSVVTFGAPQGFNKYVVESYNKRINYSYHFKNGNDIVCNVAPFWMGYGRTDKLFNIGFILKNWHKIIGSHVYHYPISYMKNIKELYSK